MKRGIKISLVVVGVIAGLVALFFTCADVWVSRYAEKRVRAELEKVELPYQIAFEHIHVFLMTGCVDLDGLEITTKGKSEGLDTLRVAIPHLVVSNIHYGQLIRNKTLAAHRVDVLKLSANAQIAKSKTAFTIDSLSTTLRHVKYSFNDSTLTIRKVGTDVMNAAFQMPKSKMNIVADSLSVRLHDLCYNLKDSSFTYNDSIYELSAYRLQLKLAKSYVAIEAKKLFTKDGGAITLGRTRIWNTVGKRRLAEIRKEPSTWVDLRLKSVELSPMNLFRTKFSEGLWIDQITIDGDRFEAFRDTRLKPVRPYLMPQAALLKMKYPIRIDAIEAKLKTIAVGVLCTDKNFGEMEIKNVTANVCDFNNKRGSTASIRMNAQLGATGNMSGDIKMHMNSINSFDVDLRGKTIETSELTTMIKPLAAVELNCSVDSMHVKYTADKTSLSGNVLFAYHGLRGKVYKNEEIPFKIISKNAGALEYFVNNLIPKSNPRKGLKEPLAYHVEYVRKEMQPIPMYMVMPVILGAVETFLPGFFVRKKVNKDNL